MGMKKFFSLAVYGASILSFVACTQGPKVTNAETFRNQTGIIGVFRQAATFCSDGHPQNIKLGDTTILVKPTWSDDQDNIFFSQMKPGPAMLYSYEYQCWKDEFKLTLDQKDESRGAIPTTVVIPDTGFCKIVISFVEGDKLFSHDDLLIQEQFERWNVAVPHSAIPYCNVIDNKGGEVSFANKDSLLHESYKQAAKLTAPSNFEQVQPVVSLEAASEMVSWNSERNKILLVVWHNDPEKFAEGRRIQLNDALWTVADKEFRKWYNENKDGVRNWPRRLHQLLGYSPDTTLTYFSTVWADPKDVVRPAYEMDPTKTTMRTSFSDEPAEQSVTYYPEGYEAPAESAFGNKDEAFNMGFRNWFDETDAKYQRKRPLRLWTRLGYTYDWGNESQPYGLSEFIVMKDAEVIVNFTRANKAFLNWLDSGK